MLGVAALMCFSVLPSQSAVINPEFYIADSGGVGILIGKGLYADLYGPTIDAGMITAEITAPSDSPISQPNSTYTVPSVSFVTETEITPLPDSPITQPDPIFNASSSSASDTAFDAILSNATDPGIVAVTLDQGTPAPTASVPEPGTMVLLGSGLAFLAAYGRRRLRR